MSEPRLYYLDTDGGCGIRAARTIAEARADARREVGHGLRSVRRATDADVDWVRMMGGRVPKGRVDKAEVSPRLAAGTGGRT